VAETYLYPDSTVSGTWSVVGAATIHQAIDDPSGADDDDTTYAQGSGAAWVDQIVGFAPMTDAVEITAVEVQVRYNNAGGGANQELDYGVVIGGVSYLNGSIAVNSAVYANDTLPLPTNPATGGLWTKPQLDAVQGIIRTQDAAGKPVDSVRVTSLRLKVTYQPLSADIVVVRGEASARLRRYGQEIPQAVIDGTPELLDNELMDNVGLTHPAAPWADEEEQRLHQVRVIDFDPNTLATSATLWDQRRYLCTALDTARTARGTSADEQGVARLSAGGVFSVARASDIWVQDCQSRLVVQLGTHARGYDFAGTLTDAAATRYGAALIEPAATNLLAYSSAVEGSGAIGLGKIVATGASGTFAEEASPPQALFDSSVSGFAYKFTAGSPHSADKRATWPTTASQPANTLVRVSIDHANTGTVSGDRLTWRLRRMVNGDYWDDAANGWTATPTENPLTLAATRTRAKSKRINVGGSSTTLLFSIAQLSGGTAARIDRVYHAQLEDLAYMTSRIVTGAATYTRASQLDSWTNLSGSRSINATVFTALFHGITPWDAADVAALAAPVKVFDETYDASNWIRFYYDGTNLTLSIRASGVTTLATKAWTAVAGTYVYLGARATSAAGELGLVRTHDVFLQGVKGTSATRAADPTETTSPLYVGCDSSGNQWGGHLFEREFVQVALTDEEIAAEAA